MPKKKTVAPTVANRRAASAVKHSQRLVEKRKEARIDAADIERILGPMPDPKDVRRREKCHADLERYLRTYHAGTFYRPFSVEHKRFIASLQEAAGKSLWLVRSVFRGFGKTVLTECAAEWAITGGHKRFIPVVAASSEHADGISSSIRASFETNEILQADHPEIAWPVLALEGKHQRCRGQMFRGKATHIHWNGGILQFPSNTGAKCAGSVIMSFGWTASIRGLKRKTPGGEIIRPDMVIVDDPQTDESAESPAQCQKLLDVLVRALLGLGGHDTRISVVVPATIIRQGDAIAQLMDAREYPAWLAENIPMLKSLPSDAALALWRGEYQRVRNEFDRTIPGAQAEAALKSNAIYRKNRAAMDARADATWAACYMDTEISAVQHAMNIWLDKGEDYFLAECQGKPSERLGSGALMLDVDVIAKKTNGLAQRTAPADALAVSGFIDVAHEKLQWMLCGWRNDFGGSVLDYGEWPEGVQTLRGLEGSTLSASVFRGLVALVDRMAGQPIIRSDGQTLMLETVLVDCGDPGTRDAVFQSARGQRFPCRLVASRGRAHHQFYMPDPKKKRVFQNCFLDMWKGLGAVVVHDACVWRERFQRAIMLAPGEPGGVDIYGAPGVRHRELATQIAGERLVEKLSGTAGEMYRWARVPGTRNHFLDCGVGCMVAATLGGLRYGQEVQAIAGKVFGEGQGARTCIRKRGGFKEIES